MVEETDAEAVLTRTLLEHVRIHALVAKLRRELANNGPGSEAMSQLASRLEHHIRLEAKTMFPLIERIVPAHLLESVSLAERDRSGSTSGRKEDQD